MPGRDRRRGRRGAARAGEMRRVAGLEPRDADAVGPMPGMNLDPSHRVRRGADPFIVARAPGGAIRQVRGEDALIERGMAAEAALRDVAAPRDISVAKTQAGKPAADPGAPLTFGSPGSGAADRTAAKAGGISGSGARFQNRTTASSTAFGGTRTEG